MSNNNKMSEDSDKYKKMYWSLRHEIKDDYQFYKDKIIEYERKINVYESTTYYGKIVKIIHNTHGIIRNDKYHDLFFHKSNVIGFTLDASCEYLDVKFTVSILYGKFQAINVELNETTYSIRFIVILLAILIYHFTKKNVVYPTVFSAIILFFLNSYFV